MTVVTEDMQTIARRLKGCAVRRELPTWGEIEFAADAILGLAAAPAAPPSEDLAAKLKRLDTMPPEKTVRSGSELMDYLEAPSPPDALARARIEDHAIAGMIQDAMADCLSINNGEIIGAGLASFKAARNILTKFRALDAKGEGGWQP